MLFTKPKKCIGLDIGTHSVKAVQMSRSSGRLYVDEVGYALVDRNLVNADPTTAHGNAVKEALMTLPVSQSLLVGALPGQTVVIRYPRLPESARNNLNEAVQKEAGQNIPYDLAEVVLDWTLLEEGVDAAGAAQQLKVLLVAAKHEVLDSRIQITQNADVTLGVLGVDSLALADAAEACGFLREGETVALINVGLGSASIHFVKDGRSNFIRDVSWGARELLQAIAKERRVDLDEADRILRDAANGIDEAAAEAAKAKAEAEAAAKNKTEEAPAAKSVNPFDDPFGESAPPAPPPLGGGSLLDPLDDDPVPAVGRPTGIRSSKTLRETMTTPLARMVSEIRRSFDYYEHQLYERPVDRIILSGGISHLPLMRDVIAEELGIEAVEVANPLASALHMGDDFALGEMLQRPSQFMVAIGLAARGMADL